MLGNRIVNTDELKQELDALAGAYERTQEELGQTMPPRYMLFRRARFNRQYKNSISAGICPICHGHELSRHSEEVEEIPPSSYNAYALLTDIEYTKCSDCNRILNLSIRDAGGIF